MTDEQFVERCLRLIGRLRASGTIGEAEAVEMQVDLFRTVGK